MPLSGLFITGSDTNVGKTQVGVAIAHALTAKGVRVGVYKPVESGWADAANSDSHRLLNAIGGGHAIERVCPQRFVAPLAPNLAAKAEGRTVDDELLRSGMEYWEANCDFLIVEGAGGLYSPVTDSEFVADLAFDSGLPLLVVVPNKIGAINQTLQTLIAASTFRDGLDVAGIVLNCIDETLDDPSLASNRAQIQERAIPPVISELGFGATQFDASIDWQAIAQAVEQA